MSVSERRMMKKGWPKKLWATFLLLLCTGAFIFIYHTNKPPQKESKPISYSEKQVIKNKQSQERTEEAWKALSKGESRVNAFQYEEGIKALQEVESRYGDTQFADQARLKIGDAYLKQKNYNQAIQEYQKILNKYSPESKEHYGVLYDARWLIIKVYLEQKKYDSAFDFLKTTLPKYKYYSKEYIQQEIQQLEAIIQVAPSIESENSKIEILVYDYEKALKTGDVNLLRKCYTPEAFQNIYPHLEKSFKDKIWQREKRTVENINIIRVSQDSANVSAQAVFANSNEKFQKRMLFFQIKKQGLEWKIDGPRWAKRSQNEK